MTRDWLSVIAPMFVSHGETMMWVSIYIVYVVVTFPIVAVALLLAHDWEKRRSSRKRI